MVNGSAPRENAGVVRAVHGPGIYDLKDVVISNAIRTLPIHPCTNIDRECLSDLLIYASQ
jgi:hypothetical protein